MNGNDSNGNKMNGHAQGNGSAKGQNIVLEKESKLGREFENFDQPIVLRQSPVWARAVIWTIVGVTTFGLAWASIAELEEIVSAKGQLKPEGAVKEVQVPVNGVVQEVYIDDGDKVKEDDLLFILDNTAAVAQLQSLQKVSKSLSQENKFYRALMAESLGTADLEVAIIGLNLPQEIASLARNRMALLEENQLYRALLDIPGAAASLNGQQLSRLAASRAEYNSRVAASRSEISRTEVTLKYQKVLAPIGGTVFDLQVGRGSVPNPNLAETAVKIVPDETLIAEVFVTNQDIGFVREGMTVDVRIDSFPYHDFGDIKG